MTSAFRAARSSTVAPPALPPEATPAAGSYSAAPISRGQVPVLAHAPTDATRHEDIPPARTQAAPTAYGRDCDGKAIHSETGEKTTCRTTSSCGASAASLIRALTPGISIPLLGVVSPRPRTIGHTWCVMPLRGWY
eukprot:388732-Pyramimonas_sp.AAC.2